MGMQVPLFDSGKASITGSGAVTPDLNDHEIESVSLVQEDSAAANVNKAPKLSYALSADKKSFTIYAWKATGAGDTTLIAATAAVDVRWTAFAK